jgi:hypothetical protein
MKILTILGAMGSLLAFAASAAAEPRVLTVDNNPGSVAMFDNIAAAYAAAEPGDTILLAGSPSHYGTIGVYKRLNFVGPGYLLSENGISGFSPSQAGIAIYFMKSAELGNSSGSTVAGIAGSITMASVNSILIDRFNGQLQNSYSAGPVSNISIRRSRIFGDLGDNSSIQNSIITGLNVSYSLNSTITNSVFLGSLSSQSTTTSVSNCIFVNIHTTEASFLSHYKGQVTHSMAVGGSFLPEGGGNINGQDVLEVFLATGSEDGRWRLKAGSPAIGTGFDGVDMGAFGGPAPYVLSGLPSRPRLTRFVVPATATDASGLQFEVDAQAF